VNPTDDGSGLDRSGPVADDIDAGGTLSAGYEVAGWAIGGAWGDYGERRQ
jgi:hypothetical protein